MRNILLDWPAVFTPSLSARAGVSSHYNNYFQSVIRNDTGYMFEITIVWIIFVWIIMWIICLLCQSILCKIGEMVYQYQPADLKVIFF